MWFAITFFSFSLSRIFVYNFFNPKMCHATISFWSQKLCRFQLACAWWISVNLVLNSWKTPRLFHCFFHRHSLSLFSILMLGSWTNKLKWEREKRKNKPKIGALHKFSNPIKSFTPFLLVATNKSLLQFVGSVSRTHSCEHNVQACEM